MENTLLQRTCRQLWWNQLLFGLPAGLPPEMEAELEAELADLHGFAVVCCQTWTAESPAGSAAVRSRLEQEFSAPFAACPDIQILCIGWSNAVMFSVLQGERLEKEDLLPLLQEARQAMQGEKPCHIAVSAPLLSAGEIAHASQQVNDMLDYAVLTGWPVFFAGELPASHYDLSCRVLKSRLEADYMQAIADREFIVAFHCLERIVTQELDEDMRAIRRLKHRLLARVEMAMQLMGLAADDPAEKDEYKQLFSIAAKEDSLRGLLDAAEEIYTTLDRIEHHQSVTEKGQPEKILQYLDEHYTDASLDLTMTADVFGVSKSYISRVVNGFGGSSFTDYLSALRIGEAKELLKGTDLTVQEICEKIGYTNRWTMLRAFRRFVGMTPQEYRAYAGIRA